MRTEPSFSADPDHARLDNVEHPSEATNTQFDGDSQLLSDYRQRYGLSVDPFVDDPHFPFYTGAQRRQILEQVLHLCQFSQNVLLIAGDYGVGKTRMAQALIDALDDADDICFVEGQINSDLGSLFDEVFAQFELSDQQEFFEFCKKDSEQDGLVVLIIDNAHHLTDEVITQLFNILQENQASRLHLVLFAEPHLLGRLENINAPELVLTDFLLDKFSLAEAVDYLNFRMEMADYLGPEIFAENKVEAWWRQSQGQLLSLHEYAQEKLLTSVSSTKSRVPARSNQLVPHIVATSVLVGGLLFGYLYFGSDSSKDVAAVDTASVAPLTDSPQSESPSSANVSTSSISPNPSAVIDKNAGSPQANAVSAPSVANESKLAQPQAESLVKQSVVPLAQTNTLANSAASKQSQVNAVPLPKEDKKIITSSDSARASATTKNTGLASVLATKSGLSDQEKTILAWDASEFTLQLVGLSSEKSARDFIAAQPNKKDLLLFKSLRQGKDWFVVVTGRFPTSAKARQAAQNLPSAQSQSSPWPREIKVIQSEIKQRVQ
jgi:DamX protein